MVVLSETYILAHFTAQLMAFQSYFGLIFGCVIFCLPVANFEYSVAEPGQNDLFI